MKNSFLKLNKKINLVIVISSVLIFLFFFISVYLYYRQSISQIEASQTNLIKGFLKKESLSIENLIYQTFKNQDNLLKKELKYRVDSGIKLIKEVYINYKTKNLPDNIIQTALKESFRALKYRNGKEYFFIQHINGTLIMNNLLKKFEGKNILKFKDAEGKCIIKKVINKALKDGYGYIEYSLKNPKNGKVGKKLCYFKIFRPYDWILGVTLFYDDFKNILKKEVLKKISYRILPPSESLFIIDENNKILLSKNFNKKINIKKFQFENKNFKIEKIGKEKYLFFANKIKDINWKILLSININKVEQALNNINNDFKIFTEKGFLLSLIFLLILFGVPIYYFSKLNRKFSEDFMNLHNYILKTPEKRREFIFNEFQNIGDVFYDVVKEIKRQKNISEIITENIDIGIIFLSPELTVKYINKAGAEIFKQKKENLLGKHLRNFIKPANIKDKKEIMEENWAINRLLAGEKKVEKRLYFIIGENQYLPVDASYIALFEKGKISKIIMVFKDVAKQLERENELIEAKLFSEKLLETRSDFLANMSHEIRTPMNAIVGFVDLLADSENLNESQKKYLNIIKDSSNNLLNIINDILDISKLEKGKIDYEFRNFSIKSLIEDCINIFKFKAEEKGLELIYSIDRNIPKILKGDRFRLAQVLNNLISNAIKFTSKGSISIFAELVKDLGDKVKVKFSIKDTGIGIEKDKQDKIFESFSQADSSTTRKFGGTGLGLTICKKIIEQLGGELKVESEIGKGTIFYFILEFPVGDEIILPESEENIKLEEKNLEGLNVLIVDDDVFNQAYLIEMLKRRKFFTEVANNGIEALEKLSEKDFDIILMDIEMPELDGYETMEIIRNIENGKVIEKDVKIPENLNEKLKKCKIKVIALTGHTDEKYIKKIFQKGFDDYCSKPVEIEEIILKINKLCKSDKKVELINIDSLKDMVGDNEEVLKRLKDTFFENLKNDLHELQEAIEKKDFENIRKIAHKIKGTSGNMRAEKIESIARKVEISAEDSKDIENIKNYFQLLNNLIKDNV